MGRIDMQEYYQNIIRHAEEKGWEVNEWVHQQAKKYEPLKITVENEDGTQEEKYFDDVVGGSSWWEKIYHPIWRFYDRYIVWIWNWRSYKYWWQRRKRGWDDSVTWNLDANLTEIILPRIKRFKNIESDWKGVPSAVSADPRVEKDADGNSTEAGWNESFVIWNEILDKIIWSFEFYSDEHRDLASKETWDRWEEGMLLFVKHYRNLWW